MELLKKRDSPGKPQHVYYERLYLQMKPILELPAYVDVPKSHHLYPRNDETQGDGHEYYVMQHV